MIPIALQLNRSSSHKFSGLEIFVLYFNLFVYENQVNYKKIVKGLIINVYLLAFCAKDEIVISENRREYMESPINVSITGRSMVSEITHEGSRTNLLGTNPDADQIKLFSNELQVTEKTPPVWLTHTGDDTVVPVENSIRFYHALVRCRVPVEMHLFPYGNHGFVLNQPTDEWMKPLFI